MDNTIRHSIDDTIINDPIEKTSIKIKGVTYFNRQANLKNLYEQHLKKEDKHLTLEKFYVGNLLTFCVMYNGFEVGTIPEEYLKKFFSEEYTYELTNIHIGTIKDENGKDIYFARLFVTFKKNRTQIIAKQREKEKRDDQLQKAEAKIGSLENKLLEANQKISKLLKELDNAVTKRKESSDEKIIKDIIIKLTALKKQRIILSIIAVLATIFSIIMIIVNVNLSNQTMYVPESQKQNQTYNNSFSLIDYSQSVFPGELAHIEIKGEPDKEYTISVTYPSGKSDAWGLGKQVSDKKGRLYWSWKVGTRTESGRYPISISDGQNKLVVYFTVV